MKLRKLLLCPALGLALLAGGAVPARAQLGPQLYSLTHFFGSTRTTTVRGYGMGGAGATMSGPTSVNPAQAAAIQGYQADVRHGVISFDAGTRFNNTFVSIAVPLGKHDGVQFLYGNVSSPTQASFVGALFPGSTQKFSEQSLAIFYGRQVTNKLRLGMGAAPILATHQRLSGLGAPGVDIKFAAKPITNKVNRLGGRVGADYKFASWGNASVDYDNFWERATMTVPAALAGAGLVTTTDEFHETSLIGGIQVHPTARLALVIERERAALTGSAFNLTAHSTYAGAEWQVRPGLFLRTGSDSGRPTYGLGLQRGQLTVQAAYVNDVAGKQLSPIFGTGNHMSIVEAGYQF